MLATSIQQVSHAKPLDVHADRWTWRVWLTCGHWYDSPVSPGSVGGWQKCSNCEMAFHARTQP